MKIIKLTGFTLIELLAAVGISTILASIAVPSYLNIMSTERVKSAASKINFALMQVRKQAINLNKTITIRPKNDSWHNGWIVEDSDGTQLSQNQFTSDEKNVFSSKSQPITYHGNGRANGRYVINLNSPDTVTKRCVEISFMGRSIVKEKCSENIEGI